jgi:transcriptional regulator with XRE-family HTH domain
MNFRELLRQKGYTQTRLSQVSGVSQSNLSIYCNYRETLESSTTLTRKRLATALDMSLEQFEKTLDLAPSSLLASNRQLVGEKETSDIR